MAYRFGPFELRPEQRRLLSDGQPLALGARAFDVLLWLLQHHDRVVPAEELLQAAWPHAVVDENNLRQQVAALRRMLGAHAIATVPGRGYRFCLEPRACAHAPSLSVAVLPLANLSGDAEQEYFADAVTQEIIWALSRYRWLAVSARNTVFGYKGSGLDARRIAAEIGARYVVEGVVRRSGPRVRIVATLVDAADGGALWSERFDVGLAELFDVHDAIAECIVGRLEPEIGHAERQRVARSPRALLPAWESFHLGVWHFFRFTARDNTEALRLLQRSRELDPGFGDAHAWWAYATVMRMAYWDADPDTAQLEQALRATQQALAMDDRNAVFYALRGRVELALGDDRRAADDNTSAIRLNPTLAVAHCGLGDTLSCQGRHEEAMPCFERALTLSPRDPQRWAFLTYGALTLVFQGRYARAVEWLQQAAGIPNCQYWTSAHLAVALALHGDTAAAAAAARQLQGVEPRFTRNFARRKLFQVRDPAMMQTYLRGLAAAGIPEGLQGAGAAVYGHA
jgi:adenylate cyclase